MTIHNFFCDKIFEAQLVSKQNVFYADSTIVPFKWMAYIIIHLNNPDSKIINIRRIWNI